MFDLSPVPTATKDMKFGLLNEVKKSLASGEGNDLVLTTMDDERRLRELRHVALIGSQRFDMALPRGRKHCCETFLKAWLDACSVTQLGQFIANQFAVMREEVEQAAHRGDRWLIPPHGVEPRGQGEADAHAAYQHQAAHTILVAELADNLVVSQQQLGSRVAPMSNSDFGDLTDMRVLIEAHAVSLSIRHGDDDW